MDTQPLLIVIQCMVYLNYMFNRYVRILTSRMYHTYIHLYLITNLLISPSKCLVRLIWPHLEDTRVTALSPPSLPANAMRYSFCMDSEKWMQYVELCTFLRIFILHRYIVVQCILVTLCS